jgi:hypothetical protein
VRHINPKLKSYLEQALSTPEHLLCAAALACVGIHEEGGDNRGELVELFQETVGVAEREAWCLSFIQSLIAFVEATAWFPKLSEIPATEHCLTLWQTAPQGLRLAEPQSGCIALWQHGSTQNGHAEIVLGVLSGGSLLTVGGNTGDGSGIVREGDGVYLRLRPRKSGDFKELGFLKVF